MSGSSEKIVSVREVRDAANAAVLEILAQTWGKPTSSPRNGEVRFGTFGSKSVHVSGAKAGQWFDHEAGRGGDIFEFWAIHHLHRESARFNFLEVVKSLAVHLGLSGDPNLDRDRLGIWPP